MCWTLTGWRILIMLKILGRYTRAPTRRPMPPLALTRSHVPYTHVLSHLSCHVSPSDVTLMSALVRQCHVSIDRRLWSLTVTPAVDRCRWPQLIGQEKKKTTVLHDFSCRFYFWSPFSHPTLSGMGSTSGHEITHPITVILDGPTSYHAWFQNMIVFLKRRWLWRYVTGDIPKPMPGLVTDFDSSDGNSVADAVV